MMHFTVLPTNSLYTVRPHTITGRLGQNVAPEPQISATHPHPQPLTPDAGTDAQHAICNLQDVQFAADIQG